MPAVGRRWTAREVRALIAENPRQTPRYELVDGELLVTPSPTYYHQRVVSEFHALLFAYLEEHPIGYVLTSPSDIELEPEFLSQPDLYVVAMDEWRRNADTDILQALRLVIEVLSPSSSRHDRVRKRPKYQRHVPEYWIVDADARVVERWRPDDTRPEILDATIAWDGASSAEPLVIDLARLFARVLDNAGR